MKFRSIVLEAPVRVTTSTALPTSLSFDSPEKAVQQYQKTYDQFPTEAKRPWLRPADSRRLTNRILTQTAEDWDEMKELLSEKEASRVMQSVKHLPGALSAWEYIDQLDTGGGTKSGNVLQSAKTVRDDLLAVAQVVYRDKPDLLEKVDDIRAMSGETRSLYDEYHRDLLATIALFGKNPFQHKFIAHPKELLDEAAKLVEQLPLFRPNSNAETPSTAKPENEPPPLLYRSFSLFACLYNQLVSSGHYLHFGNNQAGQLYPRLSASASPAPSQSNE